MVDMLYPAPPAKTSDPGHKSPKTVVDRARSRTLMAGKLGQISEYTP
jgi:hypothetical protein